MGRKKVAAGFLRPGSDVTRMLTWLLPAVLLGLAFLPGCNSQNSAARKTYQQVRPISNTARLVQNASYYKRTGRVELAVDELEQARLKEPDNLELLDVLIQCYEELGDFDRAQELYEEALSRQGGHHAALENNRCYSLYLQGRLDQAETCFRKALARQPDNQKARNNLGLVLCRQGRGAEALAMWREALSDDEARARMGQALAALGKEVPPSLAGPPPTPLAAQVVAAASPPGPTLRASAPSKLEPSPSLPLPSSPPVAQVQPASPEALSSQKMAAVAEQIAARTLPGPAADAATASPSRSSSLPEQPLASKATPEPEPTTTQTAAVPAGPGPNPGPAPVSAPVATSPVKQAKKAAASPVLTALDLEGTWIEVKNGNGIHGQARDTGSRLFLEGFNVVGIGNHIDFGLEETVIAYRPEAARVARALAEKFFPGAKLEEGGRLSRDADIRVSLGRDRLSEQNIARKPQEAPAASASASAPVFPPVRVTAAPPEKATQAAAPRLAASALTAPPDFLTSQELNRVRIELKNGNGISGQAWEMRGHLALEGFTVVSVGNHKDFGLEKTVITYRPEAARVAQALSKKFFPKATLEEEGKLPPWADVRVSLGRDLIPGQAQMAQAFSGAALP